MSNFEKFGMKASSSSAAWFPSLGNPQGHHMILLIHTQPDPYLMVLRIEYPSGDRKRQPGPEIENPGR
jgi:hypothetical protein